MNFLGKSLAVTGLLFTTLLSGPALAKHHYHRHIRASIAPIYGSNNLAEEINSIVQHSGTGADIGIAIKSMKTGETFYTHNEHDLYTPASIMKILVAEAALIYLGPDYRFPTQVLTDAKTTNNGSIDGNLYLVHSGDPSLTYSDLTDLMVTLKSLQIHSINGNVYIDNMAYDQDNSGPGWDSKDMRSCYGAPINASIINHNCMALGITPGREGHSANVVENPRYYYSPVANNVVTKSAANHDCHVSLTVEADNSIDISGCMPKGHYMRGASIVVSNIVKYNETLLQGLFKRFGIQVHGYIGPKAAPEHLTPLATHESKPLRLLITEMLKKSDNVIAGSLFKKLGELYTKQPGSWNNGSFAVKHVLAQTGGVNTSGLSYVDGSGISRDNQASPAQMMQVLDYAFHNSTNYDFISALPIAGVDGTLKYRLHNIPWMARAKTGTISGVASLAGYAVSKDKEPIAFVIIVNGHNGNIWQFREMEDKIVTALTNYSRG